LSVEAVQFNVNEVELKLVAAKPVGTLGTVVSAVVTGRADDWLELFPAASLAETVNEYAVPAVRPVTAKVFVVGVPICVPFLNTLYPVTAVLSVEDVQFKVKEVSVTLAAVRLVGTDGAVVSGGAKVVAEVEIDLAD
jgi:hypothetical protein